MREVKTVKALEGAIKTLHVKFNHNLRWRNNFLITLRPIQTFYSYAKNQPVFNPCSPYRFKWL
jgi:hypothetical protein